MGDITLYEDILLTAPILRDASPLQIFLSNITSVVTNILNWISGASSYGIVRNITEDPLLLLPIGFIALYTLTGTIKRFMSRD